MSIILTLNYWILSLNCALNLLSNPWLRALPNGWIVQIPRLIWAIFRFQKIIIAGHVKHCIWNVVHNFSIVEETFTTKLQLILITLNTGFDGSTSENFDKIGGRNPANHIYGFNIIPLWGTNSAIAHIRNAAIYASVTINFWWLP